METVRSYYSWVLGFCLESAINLLCCQSKRTIIVSVIKKKKKSTQDCTTFLFFLHFEVVSFKMSSYQLSSEKNSSLAIKKKLKKNNHLPVQFQ